MPIELQLLVWSVALAFIQILVAVVGAALWLDLDTLVGNRDYKPDVPGWGGRAERAAINMIQNLALFAPLVLVAHAAGRSNATTALGAEIFFFARLAYAFVYVIGVPYLRTFVWLVSVIGLVVIFSQLL
jgi:uncharacterized MAPEG superfamily protein